ncbi:RNA polymerase sigma-70 factor (ECF subfamily) [Nocardia tenerifensis]|uniref:RNA polymerase sigma-70 factor (ECF subfamily) n=1 Tax=Nocardia tenerifensis TaxID=228006 RepID=A0A318JN66_9NOCA|nr:sigma-70 family RNA polymerase sigma factor [Nocardia tenerifensis]PXX54775.1 RNA polymerase sigma-70 factor (ECF subfamily) [Nocardia tenerifensis]
MNAPDEHTERFVHLRPLLFTIVYEILGSATESDDVLQDSYLRWRQVDLATVRDTKSYLARLVTRQALNVLRARASRREEYVGPWLPEPLLLADGDASSDVVLTEAVSMGMLVVLETLTPTERAVFVLREVFGFDYDEIASATGKSVDAVYQTARRARNHVQARRKRYAPVDTARTAAVTERFMTAATTGNMEDLLSLLAPDITWTTDSGGKVTALRELVLVGAERVGPILMAVFRYARERPEVRIETVNCNSQPALACFIGDKLEAVLVFEIDGDKIVNGYGIRNPDKLAALEIPRAISRTE